MATGMSGFRAHRIKTDKEAWENVPPVVFQSMQLLDKNAPQIGLWMDEHHRRMQEVERQLQRLSSQLQEAATERLQTRTTLEELANSIKDSAEKAQTERTVNRKCIWNVLRANTSLARHFTQSFGVEKEGPNEAEDVALASASEDDLGALETLGHAVQQRLVGLQSAFQHWEAERNAEKSRVDELEVKAGSFRADIDGTNDFLYSLRDRLKENCAIVEALNAQLDTDKQSMQELQAQRVRLVDVDEAVVEGTKRLEELHEKLEARVEGMSRLLDEYIDGTDGLFEEARQMTDAQINEHSNQVAKLLETSLHPISAYLNTMGVKADQARADLDGLGAAVPRLADDLRALEQTLEASDCKHGGREDQLTAEVSTLSEAIKQQAETANRRTSELSAALVKSSKDLGEKLNAQRSDLRGLETSLELVRQTDISGLAEELKTLERKVAQWVHAHPLPAKVSEARLYSLEARINEEMNARLLLETAVKPNKPGREFAVTGPLGALPALPQLLPPGSGDSGPATARTTASSGPATARTTASSGPATARTTASSGPATARTTASSGPLSARKTRDYVRAS